VALLRAGRAADVLALAEETEDDDGEDPDPPTLLGLALLDLGQSEAARAALSDCFLTAEAGKTTQGEMEHSDMDEGGGGRDGGLVVQPQTSMLDQPSEGPFNYPALGS
jgi:hypothetical protein